MVFRRSRRHADLGRIETLVRPVGVHMMGEHILPSNLVWSGTERSPGRTTLKSFLQETSNWESVVQGCSFRNVKRVM